METKTTSAQFNLNWGDAVKGLILAVLSAVLTMVYATLETGSMDFNWSEIGRTALITTVAYLLKNFVSPTQVVVTKVPDSVTEKVQKGTAQVQIK